MGDIRGKLYHLVILETDIPDDEIKLTEDMFLIEDLGFDSVQLVSLIADIEDVFGIEFKNANMLFDKFNRLGDLSELVESLILESEG